MNRKLKEKLTFFFFYLFRFELKIIYWKLFSYVWLDDYTLNSDYKLVERYDRSAFIK